MRKALILAIAALGLPVLAAAQDQPTAFDAARARIHRSARGQALTGASRQTAAAVVAQFLREHERGAATLASLREVVHQRSERTGLTYVRMQQEAGGLRVAGAYLKAALDGEGRLVHLIDNLADVKARALAPARVDENTALRVALAVAHPQFRGEPAATGREGNTTLFDPGTYFDSPPRVERVAILMKSGALDSGFEVETWTAKDNLLYETLVSGDGRVLSIEPRTYTDSYNIFAVDPGVSPQTVVAGPGAGNAESPKGWLDRFLIKDVSIHGNNVKAYLDTDRNNRKDPGGTAVHDGNFLTAADLGATPSSPGNKAVAVQNLFYLNNVIHDLLYKHGFDEAAGNFQNKNFGKGGAEKDPVHAEAQDGSGTDNANFATPPDGRSPRMQMFLWTGKGPDQVVVHTPFSATYLAQGAQFGPALTPTGMTGDVVLVSDGTSPATDACEPILNSLTGKIALIDRGLCNFTVKVKNAQTAGAIAAIVANNAGDTIMPMGGTDATITIPSVFIGQTDGTALKASLPANATARLTDPPPLQRDGDLDTDIVFHEYGHGLTSRMIGGMSGPMAGAIGEGMSDVLAIIINENDVVGEYSFDNPGGLRRHPYTNYPDTYGDIAPGHEVHQDGELYGAIGWLLFQNFQAAGISKDLLLDDIVDGMNFTPSSPAFENMRDGILQSVANNHPDHECLVWRAFAHYGVGVGAQGTVSPVGVITVTESFMLPPECQ